MGLADAGAEAVVIANRTRAKAEAAAALIPGQGVVADWWEQSLAKEAAACHLLVNATSLGMAGQGAFEDLAFLEALAPDALVSDLIYHPAETELLKRARELGHKTMNGLPLLMHQARLALERFTDTPVPPDRAIPAMTRALEEAE